jgi:hypothetical protein
MHGAIVKAVKTHEPARAGSRSSYPRSTRAVADDVEGGTDAQTEGLIVKEMPEVLFVCVHNAGRSQMAAGLVKMRSEGRIHVRSAGSDPGEEINPAVVMAMQRSGST